MPIQRRLPKTGFRSAMACLSAEVRLHELEKLNVAVIDLAALKTANIVPAFCEKAKVIKSGKISKAVVVKGIKVTPGARAEIEACGGKVED